MYSIDAALIQRFLDDDWMPTPLANAAGIGANTVNSGNIPVVNPVAVGSGYAANTVIRITGANTRQALATAVIHNG